ncbi:SDR family NAD(P)-dependent oxidoreductase [Streptomyces brasiliensis]|uniref:2-(R)-hydroxypropyl-CoM dehydrogenase n=1 Tax=Streptomyces brasiliensis TaxID=1954 RepID=A0A917L1I0_9ACTN|nr:SDR family NAD(P)-dependent oxidoreductase [Streptomyces brasiliensis]GGJ35307.1 2-(R)-hydroxypropyl-CoM dehydrogenase [Streptomyces brasiliensis]
MTEGATETEVFAGRTVVVTGAGGGVGQILVRGFGGQGARVVAVDRDTAALDRLKADTDVVCVPADVSKAEDVRRVVGEAGEVDILVNNAGVIDRLGMAHEVAVEEWHRLLDINLTGPFLFCNTVLPGMLERGRGVIVNVASVAGVRGGRAGAAYTVSKHGLVGLTKNIAATLGDRGIRSNAVCPGSIQTGMQDVTDAFPSALEALSRDRRKPAPALPEEIASVVMFLASDAAARINGVALPVDSGSLAF